jgi:S-adenosylmethionine:tRNA ribosyltransferase-isomerase
MPENLTPKSESAERLRVQDFDYDLPPELIAQQPLAERGASRMLLLDRRTGAFRDSFFSAFREHLRKGDLLILNDSRVIPARLFARRTIVREREKPSGRIEVMLVEPVPGPVPDAAGENRWRALVRPSRKVAIGERLAFPAPDGRIALEAEVVERGKWGERLLEFAPPQNPKRDDFFSVLDRIGHTPLPPYIHRDDADTDRDRYQTIFARERGSVAAPTAGLHFTPSMLADLGSRGVEIAHITLHVGLGTFAPLRVDRVDDVRLHRERYSISAQTADALNRALADRQRIVAVGTTVVRTLESAALDAGIAPGEQPGDEPIRPLSGSTEIFISPGFQFRLVSALLTNFHLPQSSLLMLVSAFASRENVLAAYKHAIEQRYRFFSYGDCMLIA